MQTCDVQITPQVGPRGTEERLSPNFFEEDRVDVFTSPSEMEQISDDNGVVHSWNFDDKTDSPNNALDPNMYINGKLAVSAFLVNTNTSNSDPFLFNSNTNCTSPGVNTTVYARQQSMNNVHDVLGTVEMPECNFPILGDPLTPISLFEDEDLTSVLHREDSRNRTYSEQQAVVTSDFSCEDDFRARAYSADTPLIGVGSSLFSSGPAQLAMCCETGSPEEAQNANHNMPSTSTDTATEEQVPVLDSLPSFVRDTIITSVPALMSEESLDLLMDLKKSLNQEEVTFQKPNVEAQTSASSSTVNEVIIVEDEESYTPKMKRTASYKRRRAQNNKACRESRKKRKVKLTETEEKAKQLEVENEGLRSRIKDLEREVEEVRAVVLARMSASCRKA